MNALPRRRLYDPPIGAVIRPPCRSYASRWLIDHAIKFCGDRRMKPRPCSKERRKPT